MRLPTYLDPPGLNPDDVAEQFYRHFGPGTEYAVARQQAKQDGSSPVQGPWTNHNLSVFLGLREAGVKPSADGYSTDPDGVVRSIVVVALLSGKAGMLSGVESCVKVTQVCVGRSVCIGVGAVVYMPVCWGVCVYVYIGCVILCIYLGVCVHMCVGVACWCPCVHVYVYHTHSSYEF